MNLPGLTQYSALHIGPRFYPPDIALTGDALVKLYASAYRDALRNLPAVIQEMREKAADVRGANPDALVSEVTIELADGEHRFSWDEFERWLDNAEVAP